MYDVRCDSSSPVRPSPERTPEPRCGGAPVHPASDNELGLSMYDAIRLLIYAFELELYSLSYGG
jgi:hypothetical protein